MTAAFEAVNEVADAKAARKRRQAFYTPLPLVAKLVEWADVMPCCRVLEPSAGDSRIVHQLRQAGATRIDACEIEPALYDRIRAAGAEVVASDFLKYRPGAVYDRVVMNPPFNRMTAERHIGHAWTLLAPGGLLLAVAPAALAERLDRTELKLPGCSHATWEDMGPDWFKEFGTRVRVVVVELRRDGPGGPEPVNGFANAATNNAALTIETDRDLSALWAKPSAWADGPLWRRTLREIGRAGGSCYGIDWGQVAGHLWSGWQPDPERVARSRREIEDYLKSAVGG